LRYSATQTEAIRDLRGKIMTRLEPLLKTDRATRVFEVTSQSWDDSKVILADEALQVVTFGKSLVVARGERPAEYLNIDPNGLADAGYGPSTK
jgi:hypothetical protein